MAVLFESSRCVWLFNRGIVTLFSFGRRDVADGLQQPAIVDPIRPFQHCERDRLERPPRPVRMDDLGLIETVDGLSEHIVVAVANASNRRPDTRLRQAFGIIAT